MHHLRSEQLVWTRAGDDVVVLDLDASRYLSLNDTAADLWERLDAGATDADLVASLTAAYDVDEATAAATVAAFLADLAERGYLDTTG